MRRPRLGAGRPDGKGLGCPGVGCWIAGGGGMGCPGATPDGVKARDGGCAGPGTGIRP